jgi:UDP-N-acetylmuramoyl-tripeptide--D-alanyl-D-alanine ligase
VGDHFIKNSLFAASAGILCGLDDAAIQNGILSYSPSGLRQKIYYVDDIRVIADCYNASPESMRAAIDVLCECTPKEGRRVAVLGDMLELGKDSIKLHRAVGEYLQSRGVDLLIAVGNGGVDIAQGAVKAGMDPAKTLLFIDRNDVDAIVKALASHTRAGDTVLFKASRGVKLERVISALKELHE